jgi:D-3-phosphoglycerate dehydrogenase
VCLHLTFHADRPLIGETELRQMRRCSYLINASRGSVIDEAALIGALTSGHLAGAALDVFAREPYVGQLTQFDNVVLTPHLGSYAREARLEMELQAAMSITDGLSLAMR